MKILLSAYACEPDRGSEPFVGWNWALALSQQGHQVWVLTRKSNQKAIEQIAQPENPNLQFIYYDLPQFLKWWKKGQHGVHLYYFLWQLGAVYKACQAHKIHQFECVHHVTFVSIRQPSFMGLLKIPFIFGPVAGGESTPTQLRKSFPCRGKWIDYLRDLQLQLMKCDPLMHFTYRTAQKIIVNSQETRKAVPKQYQAKTSIQLAIGLTNARVESKPISSKPWGTEFNFLFVGRLIYWKGIHLALKAFAIAKQTVPHIRFTLIGQGEDDAWLHQLANELELGNSVDWIPWLSREELLEQYKQYHALLYPSLHDSGGMVVLEALQNQLPVICLDLGGPGQIVTDSCGYVTETFHADEATVIHKLAQAIIDIASDQTRYAHLQEGAKRRVLDFQWDNMVKAIYPERP